MLPAPGDGSNNGAMPMMQETKTMTNERGDEIKVEKKLFMPNDGSRMNLLS